MGAASVFSGGLRSTCRIRLSAVGSGPREHITIHNESFAHFEWALAEEAATLSLPLIDLSPRQQRIASPMCIIHVHTQFFLHSLYALDATLSASSSSIQFRPVYQVGLLVGNALEIVLAHGPVAAVSVETLDALGGGLLAWVEPLALALAGGRWYPISFVKPITAA